MRRRYIYVYDENNNKIEYIKQDSKGNLLGRTTRIYDEKNNLAEICEYNAENKLKEKKVYSFDGETKKINEFKYNSNEIVVETSRIEISYDDNKNWIEKTKYKNDELTRYFSRTIEYY